MSPEAQRVAIGESQGWFYDSVLHCWKHPSLDRQMFIHVPDYLNDLRAIHGAFDRMALDQRRWFCNHLRQICGNDGAIYATAAQRAEAFLRAIGKWQD